MAFAAAMVASAVMTANLAMIGASNMMLYRITCPRCGTREVERTPDRKPTHCARCQAQLKECVQVDRPAQPQPEVITPTKPDAPPTLVVHDQPATVDPEAIAMLQRKLVASEITPDQYKATLKILRGET